MAQRSAAEIRSSIEANRAELGVSLERLRGEVTELTDWRAQINRHQREVLVGAAVAGFVIGGCSAAGGAEPSARRSAKAACAVSRRRRSTPGRCRCLSPAPPPR
jgi:hypothetical protein